jgi:hypothetical protein
MARTRTVASALVIIGALALSGCAADDVTSQVRKILAREKDAVDALPPTIDGAGGDPASSRHLGDLDGVGYFVTKYVDPQTGRPGFCLVLVKAGNGAVSGCASDEHGGRISVGASTMGGAKVVVRGDLVPEGWTRLNDFLIVNPDPDAAFTP